MTRKQFLKANKLDEEITETKKIIKNFQLSTLSIIKFAGVQKEKEDIFHFAFGQDHELHTLILNYFENQLLELQQEFERL